MAALSQEQIRQRIGTLPIFSPDVIATLGLLEQENTNFEMMARRLSPELTAKFLSLSNSAFYGISVQNINHAVRVLGFEAMRKTLLTSLIMDHFEEHLDPGRLDIRRFHRQAGFAAAMAKVLADVLFCKNQSDLFTAAMLHNIGVLVIAVYFQEEHDAILAVKAKGEKKPIVVEQEILGADHAEIGAMLLESLRIPASVVHAVRYHEPAVTIDFAGDAPELLYILREVARLEEVLVLPAKVTDPLLLVHELSLFATEEKSKNEKRLHVEMMEKGFLKAFCALLADSGRRMEQVLSDIFSDGLQAAGEQTV